MSVFSNDLLEREAILRGFFEAQPSVSRELADRLAQDLNAKLITPVLDRGDWSVMYNDDELETMIESGMFPLVDDLISQAYTDGYNSAVVGFAVYDDDESFG